MWSQCDAVCRPCVIQTSIYLHGLSYNLCQCQQLAHGREKIVFLNVVKKSCGFSVVKFVLSDKKIPIMLRIKTDTHIQSTCEPNDLRTVYTKRAVN